MQERKIFSYDDTNCLIGYKEMLQLSSGSHINPGENIKLKTALLKCRTKVSCGHGKYDDKYCTAAAK